MTASDLRDAVPPRTFRTLLDQGVSKHVLDGPRFRRTSRGRYVPSAVAPTTAQRLVEAAAHLPPGGALGGWSAAHLLGCEGFDGLDERLRPVPVVMGVPDGLHRRSTSAVRYLRRDLKEDDVVEVHGVPVTSPSRTATDLARLAPDLEQAVVDLDVMLQAGAVTEVALQTAVGSLRGQRGTRQARAAAALARTGARSPGETRLRLAYVLGVGAPTPLLNPRLHDDRDRFLGIPDLLDVEAGLALEYDGARWGSGARPDGHLDPDQHREDNVREEGFERHGLLVVRAGTTDLRRHRTQLVARMDAARAEGLLRGAARWTWHVVPERYPFPVREAR